MNEKVVQRGRNITCDFLRFLFALFIMSHHFGRLGGGTGPLSVERILDFC